MGIKLKTAAALLAVIILILLSAATVYGINEFFNGQGMILFMLATLFILLAFIIHEFLQDF